MSIGLALLSVVGVGIPAAADTNPLAVSAVAFSPDKVNGATFGTTTTVTWTVTDSDPAATDAGGLLTIRMQGDEPNTYIGRSYQVEYLLSGSIFGQATFVSGTAQKSTYSYAFVVPRFANATKAKWVVTEITAFDNRNHTLDARDRALARFHRSVTSTELVDSTPATFDQIQPPPFGNLYVYANGPLNHWSYFLGIHDSQSGFWKGTITLAGPGGGTLKSRLEFTADPRSLPDCNVFSGFGDTDVGCGFQVTFPAGIAPGTWSVSAVSLTDNAGNTKTYGQLNEAPVVVTTNSVLTAQNFSLTPNTFNDWTQEATAQLTFTVLGAQQGISSVIVDAADGPAGQSCRQQATTPTVNPDGSLSVSLRIFQGTRSCVVNGIAVVDGAGDVSVYGTDYGAPDPGLTITRTPDTVPPTITAVSLSPTTVAAADTGLALILVTATVVAPVAPVDGMSVVVYDSTGNPVPGASDSGGVGESPDHQVLLAFPLGFGFPPGTYTVGVSISDAGNLSTSYGPGGLPMPGGPLTFTVTSP